MARLAGRKIIITGGASGIGRATARLFRREGAAVAILDRSDNAAKAVADEIGAVAIACDVSDPSSVSAAVNKAAEAMGGLDGVINAAGVLAEAFEPPRAAFAVAVFRAEVLEDPLGDFLRVFLDIRLPFVAFGGSTNRVLRVSSRTSGFAPAAGQV